MPSTRILFLLVGFGIVAAATLFMVLRDDGKRALLLKAPALDLVYPHGTFLQEEAPARSFGGAGSYSLRYYGTDQTDAEIVAWYDAELTRLAYRVVERTPDEQLFSQDQDKLIRQYQNGPYTYRLYSLPLPFRIGTNWMRTGYRHVLCAKLSD